MASILIIDDNKLNLRLIRDMLSVSGHIVYTAESGKSALKMVAGIKLDLILTDIQMPEMSGVELMKSLKANPNCQGIPIIAVTAYTMQDDKTKIINYGFDDYLSKPLTLEKLLTTVNSHLT